MKEKLLELQMEHGIEETFWNLQEFFKSLVNAKSFCRSRS